MENKGKCFSGVNRGQRKKSDFYETPYSITKQLLDVETFKGSIREPACGNGAILKVLKHKGLKAAGSDISKGFNFLESKDKCDTIITNPPFSLAKEFILKSKKLARHKIAFLLPLSYLHGVDRYETVYSDTKFPLKKVWVFTRYPMLGDPLRRDGKYRTGMMVYAWYIWDRKHKGDATVGWINNQKYILSKKDLK